MNTDKMLKDLFHDLGLRDQLLFTGWAIREIADELVPDTEHRKTEGSNPSPHGEPGKLRRLPAPHTNTFDNLQRKAKKFLGMDE
jgi:hypothetical protein